ncbi:MAG: hypothetical protein JW779_11755 [Candidatus Thorarchaeota archaeon]|nr:hypothetical protein [Candidatus Thorarchaeota archaeon]
MAENPYCPYCGTSVRADNIRMDYDEKVKVRCPNCGGLFEYLPGFGAFSLPGEQPRRQRDQPPSTSFDGSYPGAVYESDVPWTTERPQQQQSGCGTCCSIACCCFLFLFVIVPLLVVFGFFGSIFWLFG